MIVTVVCLLLVNQYPSPVDDCPCFEDAIAFVSVILGIIGSFWCSQRVPALNADLFTSVTPGAALDSPAAITTWVLFALLKLVTGILIVFAWRILAKPSVQTLLPPLFRWLAWASPVRLPHRRHYTPATEYVNGPPHTLRAVPSMIDLDLTVSELVDEDAGVASGRRGRSEGAIKRRGSPSEFVQEKKAVMFEAGEGGTGEDDEVKHYDADGTWALSLPVVVLTCLVGFASSDEGGGICRHWRYLDCDRTRDVRGPRVGCLRVLLLCVTVYPLKIRMEVSVLLFIGFAQFGIVYIQSAHFTRVPPALQQKSRPEG